MTDWGQAATAHFHGNGSPVGVVTPGGIGDLYVDDTGPGLWQATGLTSADWSQVGSGGSGGIIGKVIAFDTPGLAAGVPFWTPTVDTYILNAWFEVPHNGQWDGTTPLADFGVIAEAVGIFRASTGSAAVQLDGGVGWQPLDGSDEALLGPSGGYTVLTTLTDPYNGSNFTPPIKVTAETPIAVWVTQDGTPGADAPGGTTGTALLVVQTAPVPS